MTIADENQIPRPAIKLTKSLDTIAALRSAMERRLAEQNQQVAEAVPAPIVTQPDPLNVPSETPHSAKETLNNPIVLDLDTSSQTEVIPPSNIDTSTVSPPTVEISSFSFAKLAKIVAETKAEELSTASPNPGLPQAPPLLNELISEPSLPSVSEIPPFSMTQLAELVARSNHYFIQNQTHTDPPRSDLTEQEPVAEPKARTETNPSFVETPEPLPHKKETKREEGTKPSTDQSPEIDPTEWSRIMFRIADRSQKIAQEFISRNDQAAVNPLPFDPAHIGEALVELTNRVLNDPERFTEAQLALWQGYVHLWQSTLARIQGNPQPPVITPSPSDKRFLDKDWQNVWVFDFIKQSYLLTADWVHKLLQQEGDTLDPKISQKLKFFTRQLLDAISPSNFWMTNPEVLRVTLESGGENLIKGLEHLLEDLERGHGMLRITMSNDEAFEVGKNLATTPGRIVYQNNLMQLIQYEAQTPLVQRVPLLIIPPWINKYYILDLKEKNSFIRYLVDQGYTVFCISWVNPTARHALMNFDDYMSEGVLSAIRDIKRLSGEDTLNTLGYCIGGTLLASTLAYLNGLPHRPHDFPKIESATYLVTMIDFSEPGDLGVFIDEEQVKAIEARMAKQGYLDAASLSTTFNMLRANDLIWSFVVNNYLLGREPFPFDILYWNADSTNLPAVMQSFYLRKMYLTNKLIEPGGLSMKDVPIDLRTITTPSFLLSTHDDHIAPWQATYASTQLYKGPVKFVLAGSGHIAGVINHPAANKYGYWTNENCPTKADDWFHDAEQHRGSWWPEWLAWLKDYSRDLVTARKIGESIESAPGSYVKVKAS